MTGAWQQARERAWEPLCPPLLARTGLLTAEPFLEEGNLLAPFLSQPPFQWVMFWDRCTIDSTRLTPLWLSSIVFHSASLGFHRWESGERFISSLVAYYIAVVATGTRGTGISRLSREREERWALCSTCQLTIKTQSTICGFKKINILTVIFSLHRL